MAPSIITKSKSIHILIHTKKIQQSPPCMICILLYGKAIKMGPFMASTAKPTSTMEPKKHQSSKSTHTPPTPKQIPPSNQYVTISSSHGIAMDKMEINLAYMHKCTSITAPKN